MTFSRVNPGGWALYEVLTSSQMNSLDINMTRALDGYQGGNYEPSSDLTVWGKIIGESVAERVFFYPITVARPRAAEWSYDFDPGAGQFNWESDNTAYPVLDFSLNRFLPETCRLKKLRAYVDPGSVVAGGGRMRIDLYLIAYDGQSWVPGAANPYDSSLYPSESVSTPDWITMISGYHTGADNQSVLTDTLKGWKVDTLVGLTVVNETDGSSGVITANTATTITATLSGGTENDWDNGDRYSIEMDLEIENSTYMYVASVVGTSAATVDLCTSFEVTYSEGDYLAP